MGIDITGTLAGAPISLEIGAVGVAEIVQNVKIILSTIKGSVPLDRDFGVDAEFLDKPMPVAMGLLTADIATQVEKYEPRVKVTKVEFIESTMDGKLVPKVSIKIKEGY